MSAATRSAHEAALPLASSVPSVGVHAGGSVEWDRFVRRQPNWTPFHLWAWRDLLRRVFGHRSTYLSARDREGGLTGILPLVRVRSPLFGDYLVSMPFLNYGGPLGSESAVRALTRRARELADAEGISLLELRSREPLPLELPVSHRKVTVLMDLPEDGDLEALWMGHLKSKVRSQVRRPRKEGVRTRFGHDQVGPFYEVFCRHMRDLGTPVLPRRLFEALPEAFGEDVWFGTAWLDGRPVAAGCGFRWPGEFELTWAADLIEHRRIAPNMLLYWAFMERCVEEGLRRFNFGRCTPGSGTHRFKSQWGTRDEQLHWYQHAPAGETAKTPSPEDEAYAWGPRLWRRLPLPVANALGPWVVRYIP